MKLNNKFLNSHWVIEEIREEIEKSLESKQNGNKVHQHFRDIAKVVLRWNFLANLKLENRNGIVSWFCSLDLVSVLGRTALLQAFSIINM